MAKNYGSLIKEAIVLLEKYTASKHNSDEFTEDATKDLQDMDVLDKEFLIDVVSGCLEHKSLLDIVINPFYNLDAKIRRKEHHWQLSVICYLTIFHLDDLGLQTFSNIVCSLDIKKMHTFISFLFTNLATWIQDEWSCIYDVEYVRERWIGPLLRRRSEIETLMERLVAKETQLQSMPAKTTEPVGFSFLKRKPHSPPQPPRSPLLEKHRPVPNSTYDIGKEVHMIDELKQKNHQMTEALLHEATTTPFRCANPRKSDHTKRVMAQIKEEMDSKLKFSAVHKCERSPAKKMWPVKLNSATILRQGALHNRKVEEEVQRIATLAGGAYELSPFLQWQKEMQEKERREKLARIQQKHAEVLMSRFEMALSRAQTMEHKKKTALLTKEEESQLTLIRAQKKLQDMKEKRDIVQQMSENCKKNPKVAKEKVKKFKQSVVKEVSGHNQELLLQAQEQAQAELNRKFLTISELHAIECAPLIRFKYFDDTEIAGHNLLGEMSHAELKERLFYMKEAEMSEQQKKRECILEEMEKKKQLLLDNVDTINLHNRALAIAATIRKEEEKEAKMRLQQSREEMFAVLRKKGEETKQQCQKLKESEHNKAKPSKQASSSPSPSHPGRTKEANHKITWEDLEQRLEQYVERKDLTLVPRRGTFKK
uniref:cilia- and flagella-associated protein 99-like isoform X2 n=1 Tax=Doryrhamphus excisus TaxID=161450 RepID=UPI0025AEAD5C|nr:cilia- and flagella-associated protein 99-like isoform X2 [Doryrhamphus excisus]